MPECLDSFPWRSLKGCGEMAPAMFKVGDFKNDQLKDGSPVQFRLIGFKHDRTRSGVVLPMTWEMVDCMPNRYSWNQRDTIEGSWGGTQLRRAMNDPDGSIYKLMPDEIIEVAVPVVKLTANTYNGENSIIETEDLFWVKSEKETFGRNIYSSPGEGHWYEWYRQEDNPWYKKRNGNREHTMLRSPRSSNSTFFCIVYTNGTAGANNAYNSFGLAPAFSF
jgi:hypothetical protein